MKSKLVISSLYYIAVSQAVDGLLLPLTPNQRAYNFRRIAQTTNNGAQHPQHWKIGQLRRSRLLSKSDTEEQDTVVVEPGSENDVFTKQQWDDIQESQPSQWNVMKELLGINIFTYILAFLIVGFGGLNLILGPGWLGGTLGIEGTGSIEEVSPSLPDTMDLNKDEYLL